MKLNNLTLTELKALSYADIAYMILSENKKTYNTAVLFKKVCELLEYSEEEFTAKVGDFYTSLTTDCRFLILENAEWDLRDKHVVKMSVDDEDEDEEVVDEEESSEEEDEVEEETEEENIDEPIDDDLDDVDDDLEDLSIIDDDIEES